jgi:hypothetical protein
MASIRELPWDLLNRITYYFETGIKIIPLLQALRAKVLLRT